MKSTKLNLTTGFEIEITPLPPYSLDALQQKYRPVDFKRAIEVASGATEYLVYEPPDVTPDPKEMPDEYQLWLQYQAHRTKEQDKAETYYRERAFFLLAKCVKVLTGPSTCEDTDWIETMEAFGLEVPTNPVRRKVIWLWQVVFGGGMEFYTVTEKYAVIDNLSMEDVKAAIIGMEVTYDDEPLMDVVKRLPSSLFNYNLRMTEAEACFEAGITPEQWYDMERPARAQQVAGYLAPKWRETIEILTSRTKPS